MISARAGVCLATLAGCSSTTQPTVTDAGTTRDVPAVDTPSGTDVPVTNVDAGTFLPPRGGQVAITVYGSPLSLSASAAFWEPSPSSDAGNGVTCTQRGNATCGVRVCTQGSLVGGVSPVTAGNLTLTDATGLEGTITASAMGTYASAFSMPTTVRPGDVLTLHAAGGDVPAFMTMLTMPPALTVLSPADGDMPLIDRAAGFTARWTPQAGNVRVQLAQVVTLGLTALEGGVTAQCIFAGTAGTGTLTADMLTDFVTVAQGGNGITAVVLATASSDMVSGDYTVRVDANSGGVLLTASIE